MAYQLRDYEYDLYMRVDSNTRGHHQWFYFTVSNKYLTTPNFKQKVKFNIVNFTKNASLYHQGMRIAVYSEKEVALKRGKNNVELPNEGWVKGCENIVYKLSKLS